jgi:hypothetical protein
VIPRAGRRRDAADPRRILARVNRPAELDRVFDGLRPHPHRGDLVAAGAVVLAVAVGLVNVRMDATWGTGIFFVLDLLAFALVFSMGMLAELEGGQPRPYQSALLVAGLWLLGLTLFRLAQVFGVDEPFSASGTLFWTALVLSGVAAWPAWTRSSAICALIEVLAGGAALLAFVDWVFDPRGPTTFRWILLLLLAIYVLASLWRRDRERRHAVQMVNAAGLAVVALELTFFGSLITILGVRLGAPGFGWALIMFGGGFGLVAYAAVDREPGPAYLGVLVLTLAVLLVGSPNPTGDLLFWPLFLLLIGVAGVALGLRPRRRLPPEPGQARRAPTMPLRRERGAEGTIAPDPVAPPPPRHPPPDEPPLPPPD